VRRLARGPAVVNANIEFADRPCFRRALQVRSGGLRVGILGVMAPAAFEAIELDARRGLHCLDPEPLVNALAAELRRDADFVILLSHSGIDADRRLARRSRDIDVILSSHCHSKVESAIENGVLVAKAPELGEGYVDLTLRRGRRPDLVIRRPERRLRFQRREFCFLNPLLDAAETLLSSPGLEVPTDRVDCGRRERFIALLASDLACAHAADTGMLNEYAMRGDLRGGTLRMGEVHELFPFADPLVVVELSRDERSRLQEIAAGHPFERIAVADLPPRPSDQVRVVMTSYLAVNVFGMSSARLTPCGGTLCEHVLRRGEALLRGATARGDS
jgi:2',3'-cyclic-nucleotide 2'-phosphodiesterase (5'-nucleotidase family)